MQIALPWVEEKIASVNDVLLLFVSALNYGEKVEPEFYKTMKDIVAKRFADRNITVLYHIYDQETIGFPYPADKIYVFHPGNNTVLACLDPVYAVQNLVQYVYHAESVWKKIPIRDLLDRDKIFTDEDLQKDMPVATKSPDDIIRLQAEEYPTVWAMIKNFFGTGRKVIVQGIKDRKVFAKKDVVDQRLSVCRGCEHFVAGNNRCKQCGCGMDGKAKFLAAECPIGKW